MNTGRSVLAVFSGLVILSFLTVHNASAHDIIVVINEVELNPPGNDNSNTVIEQIELYNGGPAPLDISGWSISSTAGEPVTITIDEDSVIPAKGFLVISQGLQWLDNVDEVIVLHNSNGSVIDSAGPFEDGDDDARTWQRSSDGAQNWQFRSGTIASSNNLEESDENAVIPDNLFPA